LIEGGGPASIYVCAKFEEAIIMQIEPIGGVAEEEYSEVATPVENREYIKNNGA